MHIYNNQKKKYKNKTKQKPTKFRGLRESGPPLQGETLESNEKYGVLF